ncbi:MAG: NADH-quinone oxidoreductase subunit C [Sedimentisphaerales bacterium]|nr:NADH-quinone oxidoreductase subunit C [Sedimentisphaerales bacterium]
MAENDILNKIQDRLGPFAESIFQRNERRIYVDIPPEKTLQANRIVFEDMGGRLATATGRDTPNRIEVLYHYCFDGPGVVVTLRTWTEKPDCELDSVATLFPGANFVEREIQDLLGVRFRDHPDPRRLILADDWPEGVYPLRHDYEARKGRKETPEFLRELTNEGTTP